jgi:anthranilate/para-aminobenzoate synthase component I
MAAIREKEGRERAYFMGNLVYFDSYTGFSDSSIAIRTAVRRSNQPWEFAAGSGLVIHSKPLEEMAEVRTKARVVLDDLGNA